ncbi:murein biosynthesis integral membrane protein MurJ [Mycetocola tolaasinivorans]|uniref:Murein biosynthesis integral membrane protein MurJ n=1 Tax=Mycetocola tolaasinivorans TaxID=76635 RepID=A0A3L7A4H4_9MICO|nr:murein biosynthesis integral membrane protein MurJ [Mycetocola tolaasinivorans]RLP75236.1 murein biosynthesis integral membrane protein MurJ [Mycetocola tolaasinivorans]
MAKPVSIPGIGRASAFLASGTMVSRVLGFIKAILIARTIGQVGVSGDAFGTANILPNTIFTIIAGGVLSAILVPQIVKATVHADRGAAYINKLLTITLTILAATTVAAMAAAPLLVKVWSSYGPEQTALATVFAVWCLPQLFFYGLYSMLGEILNAHKIFGPFTWSPALNNVVAIAGLFVFMGMFGADSQGLREASDWTPAMVAVLAGTATLGVAAQALILFRYWKVLGLRFRPDFAWRGVGLAETGKLAGWSFAMILVTTVAGIVQSTVVSGASGPNNASIFALQNAWLIFMLPHSVLAVSLTTAYFTRMAEHARARDMEALKLDVSASLRNVSMMIVASAAVLFAVAIPFGSLFAGSPGQAVSMGFVIIAFVVGLVPFCFLFVLQRTFYALGDTRTPFFFTLFQAVLFCILAAGCLLLDKSLIGFGVALATSIAGTAQTFVAFFLLRRRLHGLDVQQIVNSMSIFTFSAIPATIAGGFVVLVMGGMNVEGWALSTPVAAMFTMVIAGAVTTLVYVFFLWVFRARELATIAAPFTKVLRRLRRA